MLETSRSKGGIVALFVLFAVLGVSCGAGSSGDPQRAADGTVSGTLVGAGASSQNAAMAGWQAGFQALNPDTTIEYDPVGSGGGRKQFLAGGIDFAGSDSYLSDDEYAASIDSCPGNGGAINLPHYVSPIAVAFNLPGVAALNLTPEALARIFAGEIQQWDHPDLVSVNPEADLPAWPINPVHRSDESGTSKNFTDYLAAAAPEFWTYGAVETWPLAHGEGAQGTSGVIQAISAGEGSIGYADASQVTEALGIASVGVGGSFVDFSPEAAARILDVSERVAGRGEYDFSFDLVRDTSEVGTYPIALISYHIVCLQYEDEAQADLVKEFLTYVASEEGQKAAAEAAGSAPLSADLRTQLQSAIDQISVAD